MRKMTGGCLCGQLRYIAEAEPLFTGVCHCHSCQKEAGSAFSVFVAVPRRMIANFRVYESITDQEAIPRLRKLAGEMVQRFMETGKVESAGIIPGIRGGFFVLDVDSAEKLMDLVGDAHELFDVGFDPIVSVEALGEFFKGHPPV